MRLSFDNKRIESILTVFPENERIAKKETSIVDLYDSGIRYMLDQKWLSREEIGGLISVTFTPDCYIPTATQVLQGVLELDQGTMCVDIPQAEAGYVIGIMEGFMLLEHMEDKKVLLCTGNTINKVSQKKKADEMPGGDMATISILSRSQGGENSFFDIRGEGSMAECFPVGAWKQEARKKRDAFVVVDGKKVDGLHVLGDEKAIKRYIEDNHSEYIGELMSYANVGEDDIDVSIEITIYAIDENPTGYASREYVRNVMNRCGNSYSSIVPIVLCEMGEAKPGEKDVKMMLSSFGAGMTWAGAILSQRDMPHCECINSWL